MTHPMDQAPLCIIQAGKRKSLELAQAVIKGCGGGDVHYGDLDPDALAGDWMPVVIGVHPSTVDTLHGLRRARRPFVTLDNGYFRPYKEGGYFRATTNALQWIASRDDLRVGRKFDCSEIGRRRFEALDLEVKPWRTEDREGYVLIVLQSPVWLEMMGEESTWCERIIEIIRRYDPSREIVVRHKPLKGAPPQPTLEEHLAGASAVIAYSSNVLLKAAMAGIPICTTAYAATSPLGCCTPDSIMLGGAFPERESILHALAANQWTLDEITSGDMWRALRDRYEPEFPFLS